MEGVSGLFVESDCFSLCVCVRVDPGALGAD